MTHSVAPPNRSAGDESRNRPPVAVTVDIVLFTIRDGELSLLLVERGAEPFRGAWALPGGFVLPDEDLVEAALRELAEETGISRDAVWIEQSGAYGAPDRDPRMRVVTVAFWGACARLPEPEAGTDAAFAEVLPMAKVESGEIQLAFDHRRIVDDALELLRSKLEDTALAATFCDPPFTISDLRRVYETIWDVRLDPGNFQRKVRDNQPAFRSRARVAKRRRQRQRPRVGLPPVVRSQAPPTASAPPGTGRRVRSTPIAPPPDAMAAPAFATPVEAMDSVGSEEPPTAGASGEPAMGVVRGRPGRPASLWTADDPGARLPSPILRPPAVPDDG